MKGKLRQMDLSFLPDQNTEEDNQKFEDCRYTKKEGMTIDRFFNLIMEKHFMDHSDFIDEWFDRGFNG